MAGYLPARLIPLLGVSTLDDIDETSLQRLIGVDEAPDLEFKGENYEASDGKRKELAYDIADRANHVGGLIIVGIEEEAGRAISLSPVEPDPHGAEETTRIYQIVGSKIHPYPSIFVRRVDSAREPGKVFYAISIPPSSWAPHGVLVGDSALRWPRRSGTSRRWMSESEIADAYRQRHGQEHDQLERAHNIHSEIAEELRTADGWLIVTLVPNQSGDLPSARTSIDEHRSWLRQRRTVEFPAFMRTAGFGQIRADFRSIRFSDAGQPDALPYSQQGRTYQDGSGTFATRYRIDGNGDLIEVADEVLLGDVINSLLLLGSHAVDRALTGGEAVILAQLIGDAVVPMVLTGLDGLISDQLDGSVKVSGATPLSRHMVRLEDTSTPGPELLLAARPVLADLISPFGIPEPRQLSEDGVLGLRLLPQTGSRQAVRAWAERFGAAYHE